MTERTPAIAHPTGAPLRSSNLFSAALTTIALGAFAPFDIIPGLGFHPGAVMLSIGASSRKRSLPASPSSPERVRRRQVSKLSFGSPLYFYVDSARSELGIRESFKANEKIHPPASRKWLR